MLNDDDVTMTPVAHILANATASCDFDEFPVDEDDRAAQWLHILESKSSDRGFMGLVESIMENGFDPTQPIGWDDMTGYINEGHHRLTAAILLCVDEIPTNKWSNGDREYSAFTGRGFPNSTPLGISVY